MHYTLHICAVILTGMILWLWYYILKSFLIRKKPQSSGITKVKAESKPEIKMLPMPKPGFPLSPRAEDEPPAKPQPEKTNAERIAELIVLKHINLD